MSKSKRPNISTRLMPATLAMISGASANVWAASEFGLDVGVGAEHHSNAARTAVDEQSDVARLATVGVSWRNTNSALLGDVDYQARRRDFADNVQSDETAIDGRSSLRWDAVPRAFDVIVQHQISTTQTAARTADVADNRERRSVLSGGVDGFLHLSNVDTIILSPRYTDIQFSRSSQANSQRTGADIDWQHRSSAVSSFGVSTNYTKVKFDQSIQDYDQTSAELNYSTTLARLSYSLSAGYNWINRDQFADVSGYTARLVAAYRGEGLEVGGSAVRELTDTSVGLSQQTFSIANFTPNDTNFGQPDVVERTQADVYVRWDLTQATELNAGAGISNDNYKVTPQDRDMQYVQVGAGHALNSYWHLDLSVRVSKDHSSAQGLANADFTDVTSTAGARYQFNPRLNLQFSLSRVDRSADTSSQEYTDVVSLISLNYKIF